MRRMDTLDSTADFQLARVAGAIAEPARGGYRRYLGWTMSLLPVPANWRRAREVLAPIGESARGGSPPTETDLLHSALDAYEVPPDEVAPLVAWQSR